MKKLLVFAIVVVAVLVGKRMIERMSSENAIDAAKRRVVTVLESQKSGDEQTALSSWGSGAMAMSGDDMRNYVDGFAAWKRERGIDQLKSFTVGEVAVGPGSGSIRVKVTID